MNEDLRYSVFGNFLRSKIFGLRSSEIFHERRSSVFGLRSKSLFGATLVQCGVHRLRSHCSGQCGHTGEIAHFNMLLDCYEDQLTLLTTRRGDRWLTWFLHHMFHVHELWNNYSINLYCYQCRICLNNHLLYF